MKGVTSLKFIELTRRSHVCSLRAVDHVCHVETCFSIVVMMKRKECQAFHKRLRGEAFLVTELSRHERKETVIHAPLRSINGGLLS